jgi:hypothetical protein
MVSPAASLAHAALHSSLFIEQSFIYCADFLHDDEPFAIAKGSLKFNFDPTTWQKKSAKRLPTSGADGAIAPRSSRTIGGKL